MTNLKNLYKELENLMKLDDIEYVRQGGIRKQKELQSEIRKLEDELLKKWDEELEKFKALL